MVSHTEAGELPFHPMQRGARGTADRDTFTGAPGKPPVDAGPGRQSPDEVLLQAFLLSPQPLTGFLGQASVKRRVRIPGVVVCADRGQESLSGKRHAAGGVHGLPRRKNRGFGVQHGPVEIENYGPEIGGWRLPGVRQLAVGWLDKGRPGCPVMPPSGPVLGPSR
jgi:hypothetical protein